LTPDESLPSELALSLTSEHLRYGGNHVMTTTGENEAGVVDEVAELALMLADGPTTSSDRTSRRRSSTRTSKASNAKKTTKSKKCKHQEEDDEEEEEEGEEEEEEVVDDAPCEVCGKSGDDDKAILCETCDGAFHMYCLSPPLHAVPEGDWFCAKCSDAMKASLNQEVVVKKEAAQVDAMIDENAATILASKPKKTTSKKTKKAAVAAEEDEEEESKSNERHILKEINA
jgi:hypothetical protein